MILLIDNYDSFVFNLARHFRELGLETRVIRNDAVTITQVADWAPAAIVLSPGPCTPDEAGISVEIIQHFMGTIPILGVCLGHQAIAVAFGSKIMRASEPMHGRTSPVHHNGSELFAGIPSPFTATRYHSLIVDESTLSAKLRVIARLSDGQPMALQHCKLPVFGVQFHPESVLTDCGKRLLTNFLAATNLKVAASSVEISPEFELPQSEEIVLPTPLHW